MRTYAPCVPSFHPRASWPGMLVVPACRDAIHVLYFAPSTWRPLLAPALGGRATADSGSVLGWRCHHWAGDSGPESLVANMGHPDGSLHACPATSIVRGEGAMPRDGRRHSRIAIAVRLIVPCLAVLALVAGRASISNATRAPLTIYGDALAAGWSDWSWNTAVNWQDTGNPHSGSHDVAFTFTGAWAAYRSMSTPRWTRLRTIWCVSGSTAERPAASDCG